MNLDDRSPLIGIVSFLSRMHKVGTAIEIRSCSASSADGADSDGLTITAKGRQRFEILRVARQQAGLAYATVRFLSDAVPCVSAP